MSLSLSLILSESGSATFSELEVNYPVSCVISNVMDKISKLAYIGGFGGGMVSGDQYTYDIFIGKGSRLFIRNTSSTKVYKRIENRSTSQTYKIVLDDESYLCMIPEPLMCFKDSSYSQNFSISLSDSSNLLFLDLFNCGRSTMEKWEFTSLSSDTFIFINGNKILSDCLHLENSLLSVRARMSFYEVFATLIIIGPKTAKSQNHIFGLNKSSPVLWYCSRIPKCQGLVVKLASVNREALDDFIRNTLLVYEDEICWD